MLTIEQRVDAGIALLDDKFPDWAYRINPRLLDISSSGRCVIGQLFQDQCFMSGLCKIGAAEDRVECGFASSDGGDDFRALTDEWKRRIQEIRSESDALVAV